MATPTGPNAIPEVPVVGSKVEFRGGTAGEIHKAEVTVVHGGQGGDQLGTLVDLRVAGEDHDRTSVSEDERGEDAGMWTWRWAQG